MAYSDLINRSNAAADVPREIAEQIVGDVETRSLAMQLGRRVPTTTRDSRIPILSKAPDAFFVQGDSGLKGVTSAAFENAPLVAEEIATIVVVPDNVLADAEYDLWAALRPLIARSFARRLDSAAIWGVGKPASWPAAVVPAAIAAGNTVTSTGDRVGDLLKAAERVADVDYSPTAAATRPGWEYAVAADRVDSFTASPVGSANPFPLSVAGLGIATSRSGRYWERDMAEVIVADWGNVLIGMRQDMTVTFSNSATLQDETGAIVNNMFQRDSTAMRCVMRVGYHLATPVSADNTENVPVAVVLPGSPSS
jgi:hypothetical protein